MAESKGPLTREESHLYQAMGKAGMHGNGWPPPIAMTPEKIRAAIAPVQQRVNRTREELLRESNMAKRALINTMSDTAFFNSYVAPEIKEERERDRDSERYYPGSY